MLFSTPPRAASRRAETPTTASTPNSAESGKTWGSAQEPCSQSCLKLRPLLSFVYCCYYVHSCSKDDSDAATKKLQAYGVCLAADTDSVVGTWTPVCAGRRSDADSAGFLALSTVLPFFAFPAELGLRLT